MLKKIMFFTVSLLLAGEASAACELNPAFSSPMAREIGGTTIRISADAPNDASTPIATFDSAPFGQKISYINCFPGDIYGKSIIGLQNQDTTTKIFPTLVPGIGVKVQWSNGAAFGNYPSSATIPTDDQNGVSFTYPANSYFRVMFYKIADKVSLSNMNGDLILTPGEIAYNWVNAADPANYAQKLTIGSFTIISTPACTVEDAKTIDFGTVTPAMVSAGVERNLDFSLTCKTDYGSYSTTAGVTTTTPSSDATYIKVTDAAGNTDNLGIQILNSTGGVMAVNNTVLEKMASTASDSAAQFNWKAKLINVSSGSSRPQNGQFTARAEIVMNIN